MDKTESKSSLAIVTVVSGAILTVRVVPEDTSVPDSATDSKVVPEALIIFQVFDPPSVCLSVLIVVPLEF